MLTPKDRICVECHATTPASWRPLIVGASGWLVLLIIGLMVIFSGLGLFGLLAGLCIIGGGGLIRQAVITRTNRCAICGGHAIPLDSPRAQQLRART